MGKRGEEEHNNNNKRIIDSEMGSVVEGTHSRKTGPKVVKGGGERHTDDELTQRQ
jgi:hypothetical protein